MPSQKPVNKDELNRAQYSTAVSDAVLALSAFVASYSVFHMDNYKGSSGFLMMAFAASIGAVRFCCTNPLVGLVALHQYAAWSVKVLGLPLLAAGYLHYYFPVVSLLFSVVGASLVLLERSVFFVKDVRNVIGEILGAVAVIALFGCSLVAVNGFGIVGSAGVVVAGLVIKAEGEIHGYLRVDIFHYLLAFSNIALMKGLQQFQLPPLFYSPSK